MDGGSQSAWRRDPMAAWRRSVRGSQSGAQWSRPPPAPSQVGANRDGCPWPPPAPKSRNHCSSDGTGLPFCLHKATGFEDNGWDSLPSH